MEQNIKNSVDSVVNNKVKSTNPLIAILTAVFISILISAVNLLLFIRSDMYEKVRLIQNPEQIIVNNEAIDISSPLTTEELVDIETDINNLFSSLKDDLDYPVSDLSEVELGL